MGGLSVCVYHSPLPSFAPTAPGGSATPRLCRAPAALQDAPPAFWRIGDPFAPPAPRWVGDRSRPVLEKKTLFSFVVFALAAVGLSAAGCSTKTSAPRLSRKGEACTTTSECADDLSCVPRAGAGSGGICVKGEFKISQTAKECAVIQC